MAMTPTEAEQEELARALAQLGRNTRPGRLLEYLGARHFQNQQEPLTEFRIATEVFGRSEKKFDSTEDAVVRVEAHRLRKKLKDLYDSDRRTEGLQISLPAGTYALKFNPVSPAAPDDRATETASVAGQRRIPRWIWPLAGLAGVVLAFIGVATQHQTGKPRPNPSALPAVAPSEPVSSTSADSAQGLHIMSGYSGSDVIDTSGVRWTPDRHFVSGGIWSRDSGFVRGTSRPFLFANWRTGEFGYNLPAAPGTYELRLFFISPQRVGDEKLGSFAVTLQGQTLLSSYDVNMSAFGNDVADEQVFRDVTPDKDGFVRLWFTNLAGSPMLNGLELTPGVRGKLLPIRISTQSTSFVDHAGNRWRADDYYINGFRSTERRKVSGSADPELFGAERFGHFSYAIPVDRRGSYTVVLHFAEFYYGPQLPGAGGVGSRIFHVFCNGQTLLRDFDIFKEAGSLHVVTKTFRNVKPSAQGKINLLFEPVVNHATVSGIEILDESN